MFNYLRSPLPNTPIDQIPPAPTQTLRFQQFESTPPLQNLCVRQGSNWVPHNTATLLCR